MTGKRPEGTYVAALWEQPELCIAFFGVQFGSEEGQRLYDEAGIQDEIMRALEETEGLLLNRPMMTPEGPLLMQYWRSHNDLDTFARRMPHARWWKWLVQHHGHGLGFYHEMYLLNGAEAIYEPGTRPVGPAVFCSTTDADHGEGRSRERLRRFAEAQESAAATSSRQPVP
ncbi:MAG: hypothetical protein PVSMB1_18800 [Gemmatimonadaceae bacterium]